MSRPSRAVGLIVRFVLTMAVGLVGPTGVAPAQEHRPEVARLLHQISVDSLFYHVSVLSGERPITIEDSVYLRKSDSWLADTVWTLEDRHWAANEVAAYYLERELRSFGLDVQRQRPHPPWVPDSLLESVASIESILGTQRGTGEPDKKLLLCAHYDTVHDTPGADDNASGTAAVLEAARILSQIEPYYTIVYALWDSEEQWNGSLPGSKFYARLAKENGEHIAAVINLDMIGWDGDGDHDLDIDANEHSLWLAREISRIGSTYRLDLRPRLASPFIGRSDHVHFLSEGFPAVMLIEEFYDDFNPYYHSAEDKREHINEAFYHEVAKLAVASVAHLTLGPSAVTVEADSAVPSSVEVTGSYPNPFRVQTRIAYRLPVAADVRLEVFDPVGHRVRMLIDGPRAAGRHEVLFRADDLPSGVYFYRLTVGGFSAVRQVLLVK